MAKDIMQTTVIARLQQATYDKLEREAKQPLAVIPKTELEAGFALGVQRVLDLIRTQLVV
jgi:hypothetical protein